MWYYVTMIVGFADAEARKIFGGERSRKLPADIQATALRKLIQINVSANLSDLRVPPGNCLEALRGNRAGQHSIRINDQWRICFVWTEESGASEVEITDYH